MDGDNHIRKFDAAGNPITDFAVAIENRGSDWIDLAKDQCTMYYTSEGKHVKRFDVCANVQLPDFNAVALPGRNAFALRLLQGGGLLVADTQDIRRLDSGGNDIQTYDAPGQDNWFALNLDPDGASFWSGDSTTGKFFKFDIASGAVLLTVDTGKGANNLFGLTVFGEQTNALGSISGTKFSDLNGNGIRDAGEPGLAGWTIVLTKPDTTTVSTVTDSNGDYALGSLFIGTYTVSEVMQAGWLQTAPAGGTYTFAINAGDHLSGADFGNFQFGTISGMKFNDINGNGMKDAGEPGLAGWTIVLTKPDGTTMTTTTDASGNYTFMNLGPGAYTVAEMLMPGWVQTAPPSGTYSVTITSGAAVLKQDFGNFFDIPTAACVKGVNPSGENIPPANGGQRPNGFYQLLATDKFDPNPLIFVKDMGSGTIFGPFSSGTTIKYTQALGATPDEKEMGGPDSAVAMHIKGTGDAAVYSVNFVNNKSPEVSCLVPPPPK